MKPNEEELIKEIKKRIKKNPKYIYSCNQEFKEDIIKYGFKSGYEYISWMCNNGILKNPSEIDRKVCKNTIENADCKNRGECLDKNAQRKGFKDHNERQREGGNTDYVREWAYKTGRSGILSKINEGCSLYFGDFVKDIMIHRYNGAEKMPPHNIGFDYLWIDKEGNKIKINSKGRCLCCISDNILAWIFEIGLNNIADIFILTGWDNRENLNPMYGWKFKKNDLVRKGNGTSPFKVEFWKRQSIMIIYSTKGLENYKNFQINLDWSKI